MTNNSLSEDIYAVGQLMADNLNTVGVSDADVDDGLTTLANKILNASGGKTPTILTLNTPLVVYTDKFNVTGVLTDNEDNPIEGATIQLIWNDGSEHIATGATNSSGVFSFTSTDPASVSSYSFQLFFAGDNDYNASNSSVVNVNTAKETSVLVITSPASGAVVSTDSVAVSGTAKDNDNTPLTGKNVYFLLNGSSAGSTTVGSDGSFSKTVSGLSAGSNSIRCDIAATTTHTAANQSITVYRPTFDGLADLKLIDGSQILSYADEQQDPYSQYATLETQLMNGDSPAAISGVTVQFWDFTDESSPLYLGEGDTDSNGKASYTYYSTGAGDVPIKAVVGSLLTKTYEIEDCLDYQPMTSNVHQSRWTIPSAVTSASIFGYSSNGWKYGNASSYSNMYLDTLFTGGVSVEFTLKDVNDVQPIVIITDENKTRYAGWNYSPSTKFTITSGASATTVDTVNHSLSIGAVYRVEFNDNTVKVYENDTLVQSASVTLPNSKYFRLDTGSGRYTQIKDFKVKPL